MTDLLKRHRYLILFFVLLFIPMLTNDYIQYIVNLVFIYILVTLGFNIILGYVGRFSFANAAFYGIGAYVVGILMYKVHLPFWFSLPIAGVFTAFVGILVGYPALRLHRYYLVIVTIAFMSLVQFTCIHGGSLTSGPSGFDIPSPALFGFKFTSDKSIYYIIMGVFIPILYFTARIIQSKIGRSFVAVKSSDQAAEALSINVKHTVLFAFALSGFIVGTAGGLLAITIGRITPDSFGMAEITKHFVMVVLGGLGSILGSVIGAAVMVILPELLRGIQTYQELIYGITVILFVFFAPEGVSGFLAKYLPGVSHERLYKKEGGRAKPAEYVDYQRT